MKLSREEDARLRSLLRQARAHLRRVDRIETQILTLVGDPRGENEDLKFGVVDVVWNGESLNELLRELAFRDAEKRDG